MTAKQALMRCAEMATESWQNCVYDRHGYSHWVEMKICFGEKRPVLKSDNPGFMPFSTSIEPYRFEDMNDD